jgi:hypothetical protein
LRAGEWDSFWLAICDASGQATAGFRALPSEGFRPSFFSHWYSHPQSSKPLIYKRFQDIFEAKRSHGFKMIAMLQIWTYP